MLIRDPRVQTILVRVASDYLSKELKTEVRISGLNISLFRGIVIEGLSVKDRQDHQIIAAKKISIIPGYFSYSEKKLNIKKLFLDQGVVQLLTNKGDSALSFQFIIDYFASSDTTTKPEDTTAAKWDLSVSAVQLADTRFHLQDYNSTPVDTGMDFTNLDINHINLLITDFKPDADTLNAKIRFLSAVERSGMTIRSMSCDASVSPAFMKAKNLKIKTEHSDLDMDLEFRYDSWEAYNDFLNKVNIKAEINPSVVDLSEIGNFAPEMYAMKDVVRIAGNVRGTVSNFRARDFRFATGYSTRFAGNITATGLPNVEETFVDMNIKAFSTTQEDIENLKLPEGAGSIVLPSFLKNAGTYNLKGFFTGFYNDFVANARLNTQIGSISTDLTLRTKKGSDEISYDGQANAQHLNLGELFRNKDLGFVTFRADLKGKGLDIKDVDLKASLIIDSLGLLGYTYRNIDVQGALYEKKFNGDLAVNDQNLMMKFHGLVDMSDTIPVFNFTSKIDHAQLFTMNLLKRDSVTDLTSSLRVNLQGNSIDNIDGSITLDSTWYIEGGKMVHLNKLVLQTSRDPRNYKSYHLVSDFVNADITGRFSFSQLVPSMESFITNYLASFSMNGQIQTDVPYTGQRVNYDILFRNTQQLTDMFLPFLRIAPNTKFSGSYDEGDQSISINGNSDKVTIYGMEMKNWYLKAKSRPDNLNILTGCSKFQMEQKEASDSASVLLDSLVLASDIRSDSIHYNLNWKEADSLNLIKGFLSFTNDPDIEMKINEFKVLVDNRYWTVSKDNYLVFDTASVKFHDMSFQSGDQFLKLNGLMSANKHDTLYAEFNQVDVSHADYFVGDPNINLDGILSGKLKLTNIFKDLTVLADLRLDKFSFNKEMLGDATFRILFDAVRKQFDVNSQILYHGNAGINIPFQLNGKYLLGDKEPSMDFDLTLKNLNLKMITPFVSSFMSGLKGYASGDVKITGNLEKPQFKGQVNLTRTEFRITYLNVPYSITDVVDVEPGYFGFNKITMYDSLGNKAVLNGKITHEFFRDVRLDLNIDFDDFSAFRNSYAQNNLFYGNARGTGTARISGPLDDINIAVKAKNNEGTHVIIPISLTAEVGDNDYIIFEKHEIDSLGPLYRKDETVTSTGLSLDLALQVNPSAVLEVFFPDQLGSINAKGTGTFTMNMTPYSDFTMGGTYTIQKGTFLFQLKNLMRYTMTIREGSHIWWTGDPTDANISMSAVYKSRIPLEGLTTDPDMKSVRVPTECIVHLTGKLMNPDISVSLELPNVDENVKSIVYSAIDTTNATEMTQQMINILVFNQFKSVQGGTTTNIDVGSTSLTVLTNMANSFTSKLSKNVNIGINYSRASNSAGQEFDVSFSTQVFNERLHIDGLFGMNSMNPNSTAQGASTIVGDINIAYDLNPKKRRWQLRAFNRTNTYDNFNLNNAPYTQGVGISYKRDFNRWTDLLKKQTK